MFDQELYAREKEKLNAATAISEYKTAPDAEARRVGWFWPVGLAVSAVVLSGFIWFLLLGAYGALTPAGGCVELSAGYEMMSWITFAASGVLFLRLTFLAAGRLRVNSPATMVITATLMLPLVLGFAIVLLVVNSQVLCD